MQFFIILIVFHSEFQQKEKGGHCKDTNNSIIKTFDFPNQFLSDKSMALEICQKYCSNNRMCWGCNLICYGDSVSCHNGKWNAISECEIQEDNGVDIRPMINQKPGTSFSKVICRKT